MGRGVKSKAAGQVQAQIGECQRGAAETAMSERTLGLTTLPERLFTDGPSTPFGAGTTACSASALRFGMPWPSRQALSSSCGGATGRVAVLRRSRMASTSRWRLRSPPEPGTAPGAERNPPSGPEKAQVFKSLGAPQLRGTGRLALCRDKIAVSARRRLVQPCERLRLRTSDICSASTHLCCLYSGPGTCGHNERGGVCLTSGGWRAADRAQPAWRSAAADKSQAGIQPPLEASLSDMLERRCQGGFLSSWQSRRPLPDPPERSRRNRRQPRRRIPILYVSCQGHVDVTYALAHTCMHWKEDLHGIGRSEKNVLC